MLEVKVRVIVISRNCCGRGFIAHYNRVLVSILSRSGVTDSVFATQLERYCVCVADGHSPKILGTFGIVVDPLLFPQCQ